MPCTVGAIGCCVSMSCTPKKITTCLKRWNLIPLSPIANNEDDVVDALIDEGPDDVLEDRAVADGDHHLRLGGGEGPHAGAFSGSEDNGLHRPASTVGASRHSRADIK